MIRRKGLIHEIQYETGELSAANSYHATFFPATTVLVIFLFLHGCSMIGS